MPTTMDGGDCGLRELHNEPVQVNTLRVSHYYVYTHLHPWSIYKPFHFRQPVLADAATFVIMHSTHGASVSTFVANKRPWDQIGHQID